MAKDAAAFGGVSAEVMGLSDSALPAYLFEKIQTRSLSDVMMELNRDVLDGSPEEKGMAYSALRKMGFLDSEE